jgi:sulfite exporter TauE/SafE
MLASIHPLGERARKRRWGVTVSAYVLGSSVAAALLGGALGGVGRVLSLSPAATAVAAAVLCAVGLAFDLHAGGLELPTIHRQVDKDWLDRYRGWVVGVGFGVQLGLGVVTIVNTAAVYVAFGLALLTGSVAGGVVVGATFGLARALVILGVARVRRPDQSSVSAW